MRLTSPQNPLLRSVRRAVASGRLTEDGLAVAEGVHLLEEVLDTRWQVEIVLGTSAAFEKHSDLLARTTAKKVELSPNALAAISSTETTQGLITLVRPFSWGWSDLLRRPSLVAILDGVQDPGNAGTVVRSAEAFGASGIVFLRGCVRTSNGKFLRAASGSIFRVPHQEAVEAATLLKFLSTFKLILYGLEPTAKQSVMDIDLKSDFAIVVGSEGVGLSGEIKRACIPVAVPAGKVESLNAGVAASIALFEASQQRRTR